MALPFVSISAYYPTIYHNAFPALRQVACFFLRILLKNNFIPWCFQRVL